MKRNAPSCAFKSPILGTTPIPSTKNACGSSQQPLDESVRSTTRILSLFAKNRTVPVSENEKSSQAGVTNSPVCKENSPTLATNSGKISYNVVYGKKSTKKHKTWEGDGVLEVNGKNAILKDTEGTVMGRTTVNPLNLTEGFRLFIGSKEIEIIDAVLQVTEIPAEVDARKIEVQPPLPKRFKKSDASQSTSGLKLKYEPLVMPEPSAEAQWTKQKSVKEVTLDSCLATELRPHQRYGVVFLYQCVMGLNTPEHYGAILADEMGLGKTLQCIALVWTLLRQGPYGYPVAKRVLIVAPSSLCGTWSKEFVRWLGSQRISTFVVDAKNKPKEFTKLPKTPVMIISYEMFARCYEEVEHIDFDLLICDEGHRLKNSAIKVSKLLTQLSCKRRILLTGTPVQNDLQEFFALADFVNPGILGDSAEYKQYYEDPIVASQQPDCPQDYAQLGAERAKDLNERTKPFILRRTQEVIDKYLPKKHEMVIFCRLSPQQEKLYSSVTDCWFNRTFIGDGGVPHLSVMTALKKICNHPSLLEKDQSNFLDSIGISVEKQVTGDLKSDSTGKIAVVQALLEGLEGSTDKLVLVSYFIQTLDLLAQLCDAGRLQYCRLDGNTPTGSRNNIVDQFNSKTSEFRVFLLSAKAGGVGLNLSGASRLVLFDSDWNPASDLQAMARVWRDGQKKSVYIYRLLTSGTIEEKIYQRQISKTSLSEAVVDPSNPSLMKLSNEDLKDLFTLHTYTSSLTHNLMQCPCLGQGEIREVESTPPSEDARDCQLTLHSKNTQQHLTMNQLLNWQHFAQPFSTELLQELKLIKVAEIVTYIFKNTV